MPSGMQVFGPQGQVWLDTSQKTMRLIGTMTLNQSVPQTYFDYAIAPGERAFVVATMTDKANLGYEISYPSSTVARVTYFTTYFEPGQGQINLFYGVG